jgi:aminoglycoside 3-N-acetyltransferase
VLVHSAFSKLGYVRGGAQAFLDALWAVIGRDGTIMMPSFPFNGPAAEYARRAPVFDVRKTPSLVGQLQEHFRLQPGTLRSLHPTHPFCASGKYAQRLVEGHHLTRTPFADDTPLAKFCALGGRCLLVGVGLKNCSPFRIIENPETCPYSVYESDTYRFLVRDEGGQEFTVETLVHSLDLAPLRKTEVFRAPLEQRGMLHQGRLGMADTLLVDCAGIRELLLELVQQGITPYSEEAAKFSR